MKFEDKLRALSDENLTHDDGLRLLRDVSQKRDALADAVEALRHIATFRAETESDAEIVVLIQDQAQQALARLDGET